MTEEQKQPTEGQPSVTETQPDKNSGTPEGLLSQAEVNKIIGTTRKEARQTAINDFLGELGFDNADDLKALIAASKARAEAEAAQVEAEKSELQKAQERIAALEAEKQAAEAKAAEVEAARLVDRRNAAVKAALKDATKPDAVLVLIENTKHPDLEAVADAAGEVNKDKLAALVEAAKAEWPEMFDRRQGAGSPSLSGGKTPGIDDSAAREASFMRLRRSQ